MGRGGLLNLCGSLRVSKLLQIMQQVISPTLAGSHSRASDIAFYRDTPGRISKAAIRRLARTCLVGSLPADHLLSS